MNYSPLTYIYIYISSIKTEPTSGLDSFQAQSVVSALKKLADEGRTIVTVIHQPRSSIFQVCVWICMCVCLEEEEEEEKNR